MRAFNYKKIVDISNQWLQFPRNRSWVWQSSRDDLAKYLNSPQTSISVQVRVDQLAAWAAHTGISAVAKGDQSGWRELYRCYDYYYRTLKLNIETTKLMGGRGNPAADSTTRPFHVLGMGLVFRNWEDIDVLGQTILEARSNLLFGYGWGEGTPTIFQSYVGSLYSCGAGMDVLSDELGIYSKIFQNWNNRQGLAEAISEACNYHVTETKEDAEFDLTPFDLFPSEILALYRVREKLGLETPTVSHPLLDTPFTQVPEDLSYVPDPLVEEAFRVANERLPEVVAKQLRR